MPHEKLNKILFADDSDDIRELLNMALELIGGFTVCSCSDGSTVLTSALEFSPDLIILDVLMPNANGPTALAKLKQDKRTKMLPIIFLTAKAEASDHARLLALGAQAIITKPFDPTTLSDQITAIWDKHHGG